MATNRVLTMRFTDHSGVPFADNRVWITPSTRVYDTSGTVVLEPAPITVFLDANGAGSVNLLCSDSANINPSGFSYRCTPSWKNSRPIDFLMPSGSGSIALSSIGSVPSTKGTPIVVGPQGPAGPVAVTVSATAPTSPVLNQLWLQV